jgi:hypothetical protein
MAFRGEGLTDGEAGSSSAAEVVYVLHPNVEEIPSQ